MKSANQLPKRSELNPMDCWRTTDLYATDADWEADFSRLSGEISEISAIRGTLGRSAAAFLEGLDRLYALNQALDRLYTYAVMRFHEDSGNAFYQALSDRVTTLLNAQATAASFLIPELLALPEGRIAQYRQEEPERMAVYAHFLDNVLRQKEHTLSEKEEALLAQAAEVGGGPSTIFSMLNDADIRFSSIVDEDGVETALTKGRYTTFLESKDRAVRRAAFLSLYDAYEKQKNTLAAIYSASVKADIFFARARNYSSAREAALGQDNIPVSVYDELISAVHAHLPLLHRYIALRKKALGLDEVHMYDLYAPLVPEVKWDIPYGTAEKTVWEALGILGKNYQNALQTAFSGGWIDKYENEGKRGGAYSWGSYSVHPYVLLNHTDTVNSMFTLAHEMGHALHSYFSWEKQPYLYSGHKIFVAEVASTCNEALLMEHLLERTEDKERRKYLLNYFMEQFRGTFFRQVMFAEFEMRTHDMAEKGEPLTCQVLSDLYLSLNRQYFGEDIVLDDAIAMEWARIPHFYNAFYVYQYATGYSAAIALSRKIRSEGTPAIERYLNFLSRGDSAYPIDLLRDAGVDMTQPEPVTAAMRVFAGLLDEMETLL